MEISLEPLERYSGALSLLVSTASEISELPVVADRNPYMPVLEDARTVALRLIRSRQGQKQFRNDLLARYGARCMISGCDVVDVLEAAHIDPYRGKDSNHPENGLILRADLHTMFDLDLLGIEPESLVVRLNRDALRSGYEQFEGARLRVTDPVRPSLRALRTRWLLFENRGRYGRMA